MLNVEVKVAFVDGYIGPRQKIKTYWQILGEHNAN